MPQEFEENVQSALDNGKKIEAIKILREQRGLSLKEAKEIVDGVSAVTASTGKASGSNKAIINSIILALMGFAVYKFFIEP